MLGQLNYLRQLFAIFTRNVSFFSLLVDSVTFLFERIDTLFCVLFCHFNNRVLWNHLLPWPQYFIMHYIAQNVPFGFYVSIKCLFYKRLHINFDHAFTTQYNWTMQWNLKMKNYETFRPNSSFWDWRLIYFLRLQFNYI